MSIFEGGKLKPGIYKIQNIVGQTYVDIREHNKELCCRPDYVLGGKGQVRSSSARPVSRWLIIVSGKFSLWVQDTLYEG